jgi:hypothetical protein
LAARRADGATPILHGKADMTDLSIAAYAPARAAAPSALRIGDAFSRAREIFIARWPAYCGLMAIGYGPFAVAIALMKLLTQFGAPGHEPPNPSVALAIGAAVIVGIIPAVIFLIVAPAAISYGVVQEIRGRGFFFGECLRVALRRSPAILALSIVATLYAGLASLLLIIPGLIVFCMYAVALPACVAERLGPLKSMSRSAFLTKGNRWRIFGLLALLYIIGAVLEQLVSFVAGRVVGGLLALAISTPFDVLVGAYSAIVVAALYAQLRTIREGVDIEHIAKVFE